MTFYYVPQFCGPRKSGRTQSGNSSLPSDIQLISRVFMHMSALGRDGRKAELCWECQLASSAKQSRGSQSNLEEFPECSEGQEIETASPLRPGPKTGTMSLLQHPIGQAITLPAYAVREKNGKEHVAICNPLQKLFTECL